MQVIRRISGLLRASHFGPNLLVTSLSYLCAQWYWWEGPALVIAVGVFCGQLVVGWSNDLIDYQDDLSHNRLTKPLVAGDISVRLLQRCLSAMLPIALVINLFGPLGFIGGGLSVMAIGWAVAYNFYLKFTVLSPLPFAIAFGSLPSCMALSKGELPPVWMWMGGALLGIAAHFLNVIKDMKEDHVSGIKGLPQRCGTKGSVVVAVVLILTAVALLVLSDPTLPEVLQ
jgi:4-hydroxybenzoate polyprenyltransferase